MLGARFSLTNTIPSIAVDAVVSRQIWDAPSVLNYYKSNGLLPRLVVVGLGTNGRLTPDGFDQVMRAVDERHVVYFLTARVPRVWEAETNTSIHDGVKRWPNSRMLDWHGYAGCHDNWFVGDGFHLTTDGQHAYAAFILSGLRGHYLTECK